MSNAISGYAIRDDSQEDRYVILLKDMKEKGVVNVIQQVS